MGLEAMRAAVARALIDPPFLQRLLGGEAEAAREAGLTGPEAAALRRLDRTRLGVVGEGYVAKRIEPLSSAYPRTVPLLSRLLPAAVTLAVARMGSQSAREALPAALADARMPAALRRLLQDTAALDRLLADAPAAALASSRRIQPATRLAPGPERLLLDCQGPLDRFLGPSVGAGVDYPQAPRRFLVVRQGSHAALQGLSGAAEALLAACDGTRSAAELERQHGPGSLARLQAWQDQGVLVAMGAVDPAGGGREAHRGGQEGERGAGAGEEAP